MTNTRSVLIVEDIGACALSSPCTEGNRECDKEGAIETNVDELMRAVAETEDNEAVGAEEEEDEPDSEASEMEEGNKEPGGCTEAALAFVSLRSCLRVCALCEKKEEGPEESEGWAAGEETNARPSSFPKLRSACSSMVL